MRILVSYRGIPSSPGWETGTFVVNAFCCLGHDTVPYGTYYQTNNWIDNRNHNTLLSVEYDLYLQMECGDGDRFYSELNNIKSKKRASWWFDVQLYPGRWKREIGLVSSEINFIGNKNFVGSNIYLPYAADWEKHAVPIFFIDGQYQTNKNCNQGEYITIYKDIDFLIIGSSRPEREILYKLISNAVPNANVQYITNVFREEYINYLTRSHFVINDIAGGGHGLIPMRPFETIAAGSNLITPHNDGVHDLGIPCFEYRNMEELLQLVMNLNNQPKPTNFDYQKEFLKNHTYINRCETILKTIF